MVVKAVTVYNPWALLIALQKKRHETRGFKPASMKKGDYLAIHAGRHFTKEERDYCFREPFRSVLRQHGIEYITADTMPCGVMLCLTRLVAVWRAEDIRDTLSPAERAFGNYGNKRYAWELEVIHVFEKPIPVSGQQGIWNWELPINTRKTDSLDGLTKVGQNYYDRETGELVDYQVWQPPLPAPKVAPAKPQPVTGPQQLSLW
jgi:hypothetical protein